MLVKIHDSYRRVIAICDKELIGKKFEQGILQINITPNFFQGEEKTEKEIMEIISEGAMEDAIFNIVGTRAISTAIKSGLIKKQGILKIQEIPVALSLL